MPLCRQPRHIQRCKPVYTVAQMEYHTIMSPGCGCIHTYILLFTVCHHRIACTTAAPVRKVRNACALPCLHTYRRVLQQESTLMAGDLPSVVSLNTCNAPVRVRVAHFRLQSTGLTLLSDVNIATVSFTRQLCQLSGRHCLQLQHDLLRPYLPLPQPDRLHLPDLLQPGGRLWL